VNWDVTRQVRIKPTKFDVWPYFTGYMALFFIPVTAANLDAIFRVCSTFWRMCTAVCRQVRQAVTLYPFCICSFQA